MLILLYSCLYLFMMTITTTITKVNEKIYDYAPLYITIFYMNIFYPILLLIYLKYYSYKDLLKIPIEDIKFILIPSIIYTLELVPLYWCLLYVPLGFYMIGRTSSAFFNVLFAKYYIHKTVHIYYYIGLSLLLTSYILFLIGLSSKPGNNLVDSDYKYILSIIIVFITGISTSIYNNMGEKYFITRTGTNKNKINYLIIYNLPGFIFLTPIFLGLSVKNKDFIVEYGPNIIYIIAGLCIQLYIFVKLNILATKNISGNQLVTGIELLRRVLTNVMAYLWLEEYYNTNIILANIFMFAGSCFVILGSLKSKPINREISGSRESILLEYQENNNFNDEKYNETDKIIIIEDINHIDGLDEIDLDKISNNSQEILIK